MVCNIGLKAAQKTASSTLPSIKYDHPKSCLFSYVLQHNASLLFFHSRLWWSKTEIGNIIEVEVQFAPKGIHHV